MARKPLTAPARRDPSIELLLHLIDEAFDHKAWHGPNLRGAIRGLGVARAGWRPGPGRHNIWEIVVHAAYWKYAVRRRLTGEKRGAFAVKGSNWFERPETGPEAAWRDDIALLVDEHRRLVEVVRRLRGADLAKRAPGSRYDNAFVVRGIAAHDLYHAGQIQVLKRLAP